MLEKMLKNAQSFHHFSCFWAEFPHTHIYDMSQFIMCVRDEKPLQDGVNIIHFIKQSPPPLLPVVPNVG